MTTNPYINNVDHNISPEQNLIEDLTIELIKFFGHTLVYIPRSLVKEDKIFGEDTLSRYEGSWGLEMYIESVDGFEGEGDFISRFGLEIRDRATFVLAKRRFEEVFRNKYKRPREGDLLWFPLTNSLMEILHVEHENPFYQAGKNFVYRLTCELYTYSHEEFDTGEPDVDKVGEILNNPDSVENDDFAENEAFETEGDDLKDFDENNPFGDW